MIEKTKRPWKKNEFGIDLDSLHGQRAIENAAVLAHEANRWYCLALDDSSQPVWTSAPDWQKESAIAGVKQINEHPDTTPEQSHQGWLDQKAKDGWVYGEVKDPEKKTHPCFVPYDQLPPQQRFKDSIFGAVVREALYCYGGRVARDYKRKLDETETPLSCDDPLRTYGLVAALGRADRIAEEAVKAYLAATKYPVPRDLTGSGEFYNMVVLCAVNPSIGQAYDAYRASKFPYVLWDFPSYTQIMAVHMPTLQHEALMRNRVMWHLVWGITQAVMWLEGVTFRSKYSERYARWMYSAMSAADKVNDVAEVVGATIAQEVTVSYAANADDQG